jgi:hypothetical protein
MFWQRRTQGAGRAAEVGQLPFLGGLFGAVLLGGIIHESSEILRLGAVLIVADDGRTGRARRLSSPSLRLDQ